MNGVARAKPMRTWKNPRNLAEDYGTRTPERHSSGRYGVSAADNHPEREWIPEEASGCLPSSDPAMDHSPPSNPTSGLSGLEIHARSCNTKKAKCRVRLAANPRPPKP